MPRLNTHFENVGISLKLPLGPIISPKPGPTLEIDVAAPDIEVIKFRPEKDNKIAIIKKIKKYKKIKEIIDDKNFSFIFSLL